MKTNEIFFKAKSDKNIDSLCIFDIPENGQRKKYLQLAIKTKSKGITAFKNVLNLIHLPSPGVKVTREHTPQYKAFLFN